MSADSDHREAPAHRGAPTVWSIAAPTIGVLLLSTLASLLLIKIVAPLGATAIAIVAAGQRLMLMWSIIFLGLGIATTALVARAWGAGDRDQAAACARFSVRMAWRVSLGVTLLLWLLADPLAQFFGFDAVDRPAAARFLRIIALFAAVQVVLMILSTASRATGDARTPLLVGIAASLLSLLLAWALTFGRFGLPALGIDGTAWGWGCGYLLALILYLCLWSGGRLDLGFAVPGGTRPVAVAELLRIGTPATLEPLVGQVSMLTFIWFIASHGTAAFAAYGLGLNLMSVSQVIAYGFSIAASALVGQHIGAGRRGMIARETYAALRPAVLSMGLLGAAAAFGADTIAAAMVADPAVSRLLAQFLVIIGCMQVMEAFDQVLAGAMRGAGDTLYPFRVGLGVALCVRLPLALLTMLLGLSVVWLFAILIAELAVKSLLLWRHFRRRFARTAVPV